RGLEDLTNGNLPPAPEADGASLTGGAWAPNAVTVEVSKEDFSDITDAEADAIVAHIKAGTLGTAADITELTRVASGATMRVKFAIDDIKIPTGMFVQALFTWSAEVEVDGVSAPVLAQVPYLFVPRAVEQAQVMGLRAMIEAGALYGDEDDLGW